MQIDEKTTKYLGITLLIGLICMALVYTSVPYTTSQFINSSTDINIQDYVSGVYDGQCFGIDGNIITARPCGDLNVSTIGIPGEITFIGSDGNTLTTDTGLIWDTVTNALEIDNLVIKVGGKIGIGVTAPAQLFELGAGKFLMQNNQWFGQRSSTGTQLTVLKTDTSDNLLIGETSGHNSIQFRPGIATSMIIGGDGQVGIGTTNPSEKLEIEGNVIADDYLTHTWIYDGEEKAIKQVKDKTKYYKTNGDINYEAFEYSYVPTTRYEKDGIQLVWEVIDTSCVNNYNINGIFVDETCTNIYGYVEKDKYKEVIGAVSLGKEIALLKQAIYEMKTEVCAKHPTYSWCS